MKVGLGVAKLRSAAGYAVLLISAVFVGCAPVADPSAGLSPTESVALIDGAPRTDLTIEALAESYALNSRATDVQRDMLETELIGHAVEWNLPVYDVSLDAGRFTVTSQPIPTVDAEAVPLLRVMAVVVPQSAADETLLRSVKTDDVIRVRGVVQEIRLRTVVVVIPTVVAAAAQP